MYLKSLELVGFKSFPKKSTLEFKTPITAIVGPNGSGKSNVAEAFRFVLGEQSIKSMRGRRGEDLIWNGGADLARSNRAGVKVVFDNRKGIFSAEGGSVLGRNIDFNEVSIERVVHRDGINEYLLNGSQVRLKDIVELLAAAHIGASGHHIISQGEADRILNAPFKERKAMIEDALGLKIYQYKKQESERKLLKTEENIKSVESLRREIAPHIKFLKVQVQKVEKSLRMKQELLALYKEYFKREDGYLKKCKAELTVKEKPLREHLAKLEHELEKAKNILAKSSAKDEKSEKVIAIENKIKSARDKRDVLTRNIGRLEGEISALVRLIRDEKKRLETSGDKTVHLRDLEEFSGSIDREVEKALVQNEVPALKKVLVFVRDSLKGFISRNKLQLNGNTLKSLEKEFDSLLLQKKEIEEEFGFQKNDENRLNDESAALKAEIEREKDTSRDAEKAVFKVMGEQKDVVANLHLVEEEDKRLKLIEEEFKRELQEGAAIVGREVLDFQNHQINNADEARSEQDTRRKMIEKIKIRLEDVGGGDGEDVMKEYREVTDRDAFLERELADLDKSAGALKQLIAELEEKLATLFAEGVKKINDEFNKLFVLMFGGGHASLTLVKEKASRPKLEFDDELAASMGESHGDEDEEIEEGLDISVNLPRKKIKGLTMLSGGERALTSIALLFAISQVNPPPFIILDETDAALDEANSKKYGDLVENLSKHSQLILITHNRETMSRAGVIYGVTMGASGMSGLLSIAFDEAVVIAK